DLNTHKALLRLHGMAKELESHQYKENPKLADRFVASARLLGLLEDSAAMGAWVFDGSVEVLTASRLLSTLAERLAALRDEAMASKNFAAVDSLKSSLVAAGVEVRMSKDGVELVPGAGFDTAQLEALK
ncbi:MAG: cysteine--tRNA ligase, partial [Pseudomonadota bacterium]